MKMKKLIALSLAMLMALLLVACDPSTEDNQSNTSDVQSTSTPADGSDANESSSTAADNSGTNESSSTAADNSDANESSSTAAGLEGYPATFAEWTLDDFIRYFKEEGAVDESVGFCMTMTSDMWVGFPFESSFTFTDEQSMISFSIYVVDEDKEGADGPALMESVRKNHAFDEKHYGLVVDHLVGNIIFEYNKTIDEKFYKAIDDAYNKLVAAMGVTPDF